MSGTWSERGERFAVPNDREVITVRAFDPTQPIGLLSAASTHPALAGSSDHDDPLAPYVQPREHDRGAPVLALQGIVGSADGPTLLLRPQEHPAAANVAIRSAPAEVVIAGAASNDLGFPRRYAQFAAVAVLLQGADGRYVFDESTSDWSSGEVSLPVTPYLDLTHVRADATVDPAALVIDALAARGIDDPHLRVAPLGLFMVRDGESVDPTLRLCVIARSTASSDDLAAAIQASGTSAPRRAVILDQAGVDERFAQGKASKYDATDVVLGAASAALHRGVDITPHQLARPAASVSTGTWGQPTEQWSAADGHVRAFVTMLPPTINDVEMRLAGRQLPSFTDRVRTMVSTVSLDALAYSPLEGRTPEELVRLLTSVETQASTFLPRAVTIEGDRLVLWCNPADRRVGASQALVEAIPSEQLDQLGGIDSDGTLSPLVHHIDIGSATVRTADGMLAIIEGKYGLTCPRTGTTLSLRSLQGADLVIDDPGWERFNATCTGIPLDDYTNGKARFRPTGLVTTVSAGLVSTSLTGVVQTTLTADELRPRMSAGLTSSDKVVHMVPDDPAAVREFLRSTAPTLCAAVDPGLYALAMATSDPRLALEGVDALHTPPSVGVTSAPLVGQRRVRRTAATVEEPAPATNAPQPARDVPPTRPARRPPSPGLGH